MQGHSHVIDCIAWAPFESSKTIQQADFNQLDAQKVSGFGAPADNGTTGTTISELGQEDHTKEEAEDQIDIKKLTTKERVELLKARKNEMSRRMEAKKQMAEPEEETK